MTDNITDVFPHEHTSLVDNKMLFVTRDTRCLRRGDLLQEDDGGNLTMVITHLRVRLVFQVNKGLI